jgi:hypothetical protein
MRAASRGWIQSPTFDVGVFFGPAAVGLAAFVSAVALGVSPVALLWFWLVAFDGPHMLATYSRTYCDPAVWRARPWLLVGSLSALVVGPVLLAVGPPALFSGFLVLMTVYATLHTIRQHWGFVAIYGARAGVRPSSADRWTLYAGCWLPYVWFVLWHPALRAMAELPAGVVPWADAVAWAVALAWGGIVAARSCRLTRTPKDAYLVAAVLFSGVLYFVVARLEPIFPEAQGINQQFMVLGLVNGIFHAGQYVGLVGLCHARGWRRTAPTTALLVCLPFVAGYLLLARATGLYPGSSAPDHLALALWSGLALHHYWLDERIWRVSRDPALADLLRLGPPAAAAPPGRSTPP